MGKGAVCKQGGAVGPFLLSAGTVDEVISARVLGRNTSPELEQHQRLSLLLSVTVYSLDGILVFGLLFVCTCAYFKKVPRLKTWLLSEKKGVWGVFYKGKVLSGCREKMAIPEQCGSVHEKA